LQDLQIGTFHAYTTLDSGEKVELIFPESIAIPSAASDVSLIADTQFLMAGNKYHSDLMEPKLTFSSGDEITLDVLEAHKHLYLEPKDRNNQENLRKILVFENKPYDPPSFPRIKALEHQFNQAVQLRPNPKTPTALTMHLRYGCKGKKTLQHTHKHVRGMVIQKDSWAELDKHLPCSSCVAGRFQKRHKTGHVFHSDVQNLAVSCSSAASKYTSLPNQTVSTDWGIVNKPDRHGNTAFALYLDANIGVVFDFQAPGRGLTGES